MAYLASNHKNNNNDKKIVTNKPNINQNPSKKNVYNNNGYKAVNNYNNGNNQKNSINNVNNNSLAERLKLAKEKQKKEAAKKAITTAAAAYGPIAELGAKTALNTSKGQKYLDAYAEADTQAGGIRNVKKEIKKDQRKIKFITFFIILTLPILALVIFVAVIGKNADSQIFSNQNGGTVESDHYVKDDKLLNVFANYPGLYEKIMENVKKVSDEYKQEIDIYLIISTLVSPISNDFIVPVEDNSCGEEKCYYFNGESKTWSEFLVAWGDQSELLAKMQLMTFTNPASKEQAECDSKKVMEKIADNDLQVRKMYAFWWLNPVEWFRGFRDATQAELNAYCTLAPSGKTEVPTVNTLSTVQADYYLTNNISGDYDYIKDENSGGVYFWNLVNKNGFLYEYLKDYLSDEYKEDPDKNYEINKAKILEIANYIYLYNESIKKDCDGHKIIESNNKMINIQNPKEKQTRYGIPEFQTIDFEDQYIGGVMLAEFHSSGIEGLKAFAILARSEAVSVVGLDGSGIIENSSKAQNYDPTYSPEKYPEIAKAVEETRGLVVSHYKSAEVWHTEYDAFCPVKNVLENGFYYLPDGQQNVPINPDAYKSLTGKEFIDPNSKYLDCPCFQNIDGMPSDIFHVRRTRFIESTTTPPTDPSGNPRQATKEVCWKPTGETRRDDEGTLLHGWIYSATGGHGRGASQYGIKYLDAFGYSQDAIIRIFFPDAQIRVLSSSLKSNQCVNIDYYTGEE